MQISWTSEAEKRLIHSINEMDNGLATIGVQTYDLDDLAPTLLKVYDYQQKKYVEENAFPLLSFVGRALLECYSYNKFVEIFTCEFVAKRIYLMYNAFKE